MKQKTVPSGDVLEPGLLGSPEESRQQGVRRAGIRSCGPGACAWGEVGFRGPACKEMRSQEPASSASLEGVWRTRANPANVLRGCAQFTGWIRDRRGMGRAYRCSVKKKGRKGKDSACGTWQIYVMRASKWKRGTRPKAIGIT